MSARYMLEQWKSIARQRFGDDASEWSFVCPRCGLVQNAKLFARYRVPVAGNPYKRCLGRFVTHIGGCDYSVMDPVLVCLPHAMEVYDPRRQLWQPVFDFAPVAPRLDRTIDLYPKQSEPARFYKSHTQLGGIDT